MTEKDIVQTLMVLQATFPNFKVDDKKFTVGVWMNLLEGFTAEELEAGTRLAIINNKTNFAPSISVIINEMYGLREKASPTAEMTEAEAWALVRKATAGNKAYEDLPEDIQKAVGSKRQIDEWGYAEDVNWEVVQSNFLKSYRQIIARKKEDARTPASIKNMMLGVSEKLAIEGK